MRRQVKRSASTAALSTVRALHEQLESRRHFSISCYSYVVDSEGGGTDYFWVNAPNPGHGTPTYDVSVSTAQTDGYFSVSETSGSSSLNVTVDCGDGNAMPSTGMSITGLSNTSGSNALTLYGSDSSNDTITSSSSALSFGTSQISYSNFGQTSFIAGTGTDSLVVTSGNLQLPGPSGSTGGSILTTKYSTLNISSSATVTATSLNAFSTYTYSGTTYLDHSYRQLIEVASSGLIVSGKLNLEGNDMIIHSGSLSTINSLVGAGFGGGNGIYTSETGLSGSYYDLTTLGVASQSVYAGSTFDGASVSSTDILIKYTYYGDTNLSGTIDGTDYSRYDNGTLSNLTGWENGDFNYDGVVDGSDGTLIDNAYNADGPSL
jgi:hypothetical protein